MKTIACILIVSLLPLLVAGQKVGLVLSGGGAKGLAHIGVIKVLEENNIPIDYVAGTSIGAIVAGLYASGMSSDEMLALFSSDDFKLWSTGRMDKNDLYYYKRRDEQPDWLKLDLAKNRDKIKLVLPFNLIPEVQMDFVFMQLTAQTTAACDADFDRLFVPFRSVATDIYNKEAVIFRSGDLGEAIRASMTFPFVYKPIMRDGRYLYDGGIVNNFPTDIMQADFGPDIIIGHKVTNMGNNYNTDDVLSQVETMVTQKTNYSIPDSVGILLETKLDDVSLLDFPKVNYAYSRGVETVLLMIDSIGQVVKRRASKDEVAKRRETFNSQKPKLVFNNIQVEGVEDNSQRKYVIQSIKDKENTFDMNHLREAYYNLVSDVHIKSIQPLAYYNKKTGFFDLHLKVEPRKPMNVKFGGHLSTRSNTFGFIEANYMNFRDRLYTVNSNLYFGKFYSSFNVGGKMESPTNNPFYLSCGYTLNLWDYFAPSTDLIFTDIKPSYVTQTEQNIRFEAGFPYSKTGLIDFGLTRSWSTDQYYQTNVFNKGDDLDQTLFNAYSFYIHVDKKNYDFKQYPTEGFRRYFTMRYIAGTETFKPGTTAPVQLKLTEPHSYFQIKAFYDRYFKVDKKFSLGFMAEGDLNNKKLFTNYTSSVLSAPAFSPTPNSLSMFNEYFRANQYFALGGKSVYKLTDLVHCRAELYGFFPVQRIVPGNNNMATYNEKVFSNPRLMAHASVVAQTMIGPLSAELNYYDRVGQKWFFSINFGYMLFNQRGL